ncbi:Glutaredoxin-like protein, YruB-family [Peptoclostridium litorale DSM 5388]|uniref:Glutaredoxin n=1 Tax=Peptoclostridium litorale DSM 5388 TaxID=1121324 RepID=A0A069RCP0_PEPLI|nr:glutaredoxin family protein [Peptoclostridium litorale]KDR94528.1 glutaredoxin [Peptoclostridium litorale DSM 5388]SIO35130.1 Glutaredoxin-like protein, YruB-family [Peptoclostridium litorale DSM 5388]
MNKITIYTSETCGYCHMAKEYFDEKGIAYEEKSVSADSSARKELMKMGYMSVPVIIIGEETIVGFDKQKIESLLK